MSISYTRRILVFGLVAALLLGTRPPLLARQAAPAPPVTLSKEQIELQKLNKEAIAMAKKGQRKQAVNAWEAALRKAQSPHLIGFKVQFLGNLGLEYDHLGQYDKALDYDTQVLEIYKKLNDPHYNQYIAVCLQNLGNVYDDLGQYDKSLDYHMQALDLRKQSDQAGIADSLNDIGLVYDDLGEYDKSLEYHMQALELRKQVNSPRVADSLAGMGGEYAKLGQYDKAIELQIEAQDIYKSQGKLADINGVAFNLHNIGVIYYQIQQYDKALDYYLQALELRKQRNDPAHIADSLNDIGGVYFDLGQYDKALENFKQALEIRKQAGNPAGVAGSLSNIGGVYYLMGQYDKALNFQMQGLEKKQKLGNIASIASSLGNLGHTYRKLHRLTDAETASAECLRLRESLSYQVNDPSQVGALQDTFLHFYEHYASLRLDQHKPAEALEMLEAGRGQGLQRLLLVNLTGGLSHFLTADEQKAFHTASTDVTAAHRQLQATQQQLDSSTPDQKAFLSGLVEQNQKLAAQTERTYAAVYEQMFRTHPDLTQLAGKQATTFAELQAMAHAHPDTLYLEYGIVDDKNTLLFALGDKDGLKSFTLPTGNRELTKVARLWREAL